MSAKKSKNEHRVVGKPQGPHPTSSVQRRWLLLTIRLLAALGFGIGTYLTILHHQAGAGGVINSPLCGTGTVLNCNAVLGSPYARLFDVPVALWAAGTYGVIFAASFLAQTGLLAILCMWGFAFSLYMAGLSLFVIQSACLLCMSLYAINTGLLISALVLVRSVPVLTLKQAVYAVAGCAVVISGVGWVQARAASPVAPAAPVSTQNLTKPDAEFVRYYNERPLVTLSGAERHTKGPAQAPLTIAEFVDFRCPQCARARMVLMEFVTQHPNDVRIIFRHFPLDNDCNPALSRQVHPGACAAAIASECAGEQGKFWEYAELLFSDQKQFTRQDLDTYAGTVGLEKERFNTCITSGRMKNALTEDVEEAERIGIKATPTLVVNGRLVEGLPSPQQFATLLAVTKK